MLTPREEEQIADGIRLAAATFNSLVRRARDNRIRVSIDFKSDPESEDPLQVLKISRGYECNAL